MGKIDIFRDSSVTFRNGCIMLRIVQLAHTVGECILQRGGKDPLFPNYIGEDLFWMHR